MFDEEEFIRQDRLDNMMGRNPNQNEVYSVSSDSESEV